MGRAALFRITFAIFHLPFSIISFMQQPNRDRKTLLIFSQTFVPDPASVGQHMADVAVEMARRGHRVLVFAANRSYEDASIHYPARENLHGVEVRRLPLSSFGKKSLLTRIIGTFSFMAQCLFLGLFKPNIDAIFFSTSPPMIGLAAAIVRIFRGIPISYWAMDLNPDQLIALGRLKKTGLLARLLESANKFILRNCSLVVALDRFMADRLLARARLADKLIVLPPWPHEEHIENIDPSQNPFRQRHDLNGKFVVMYSGNHSPSNPLATLLEASLAFKDDADIRFLFVGGGLLKKQIEQFIQEHSLKHVISLPYQPLADLKYSLSAADAHVVSLGNDMIGIIHPCKIYGAMAVGRPILYLGPRPSHVSDILDQHQIGWHVAHGDIQSAVQAIRDMRGINLAQLADMGQTARAVLEMKLSQSLLCGRFCDALEMTFTEGASR